jgi:hypothetical protein
MTEREMERMVGLALAGLLTLGLVGCDDGGEGSGDDAGSIGMADGGGGSDAGSGGSDAGVDGVDGGPSPEGWAVRTHDCPGINRADALWADDEGIWVGCGSGADGDGLFYSRDDGASWEIPATSPANVLTSFRVLSVHRGFGGLIYVAGEGPSGSMVISLDTATTPMTAEAVLNRGTTVGRSFLAGPFVTTSTGAAFADSFTGGDALYRADEATGPEAADWTDARDWETTDSSHQILDLVVRDGRFVGVGSTIAEPPYVFVPAADAEPFSMTPVPLVSGLGAWDGEMWGVAANAQRIVAVGVDQDNDIGKMFISGADETNPDDYTQLDLDPLVAAASGSDSTWGRGVCMDGDRIAVVGEVQPLGAGDNSGFVLLSTDGGATWAESTPAGSPASWSKCQIVGSRLVVAGGGAIGIRAF